MTASRDDLAPRTADPYEQASEATQRLLRQSAERHEVWLTKSKVLSVDEISLPPDKLRNYVHDVVIRSDPAGYTKEIASLTEQRDALVVKVRELESEIAELRKSNLK
jgi:hypothetical protein